MKILHSVVLKIWKNCKCFCLKLKRRQGWTLALDGKHWTLCWNNKFMEASMWRIPDIQQTLFICCTLFWRRKCHLEVIHSYFLSAKIEERGCKEFVLLSLSFNYRDWCCRAGAETFWMALQYLLYRFPHKQKDISPKKMEFLALSDFF